MLNDIQQTLAGVALRAGKMRNPAVRVAETEGTIWLDLCDELRRAVKITGSGWEVVSAPSIPFLRMQGMGALPEPSSGGSVEDLRSFLNVGSEDDFALIVAWLIAALRPRGPCPLLVIGGEQGSAKSTTSRMLRRLVDPNDAPIRSVPTTERDLLIAAQRSRVLCFDNVSALKPSFSDTLCRIVTGGAFSTRKLFTDDEEHLLEAQRPVILNGIPTLLTRPDLIERSICITLPPVPAVQRKTESALWSSFETVAGRVLGALLDGVSAGLRNVTSTKLERLPRMADFATWVSAAEDGLKWMPGRFMSAYEANMKTVNDDLVDDDPLASAIVRLSAEGLWSGTSTELLEKLAVLPCGVGSRSPDWPKDATRLSTALQRLQPSLSKAGCEIRFERRREGPARRRIICIAQPAHPPVAEGESKTSCGSSSSPTSASNHNAAGSEVAKPSPKRIPVGVFALRPLGTEAAE
jgi:hypothetical protein